MADRLHLHPKHREELEVLLRKHLPDVEVWAYGSRVSGKSHNGSDLDLVLRGPDLTEIPYEQLEGFTDAVRDSTIPFLVEARDWTRLPERFHEEIDRSYEVLKRATTRQASAGQLHTTYGAFRGDYSEDSLSHLCDSNNGVQTGPFGSQLHQRDYVPVGTPIITVEHLGDNRISHRNLPCVSDDDRRRLTKYALRKGDIVFSRVGSVDRRSLVRKEEHGWLFSGRCLRVRPDPQKVDSGYLSYFFGLPAFREHVRSIAVGATMPSLNTELLSNVRIFFPPLSEQEAIAHILGTLDDKIELNRRMNETREAMARAIFKDWFVDFGPTRAKMESRAPYLPPDIWDLFPSTLVNSPVGKIPEGWRQCYLSDCFTRAIGGVWGKDEPAGAATTPVACLRGVDCHALCAGRQPDAPHRWVSPRQLGKRRIPVGSILVEASGHCGRSLLWTEEYGRLFDHAVIYSNFVARLDPTCSPSETVICWHWLRRAYDDETVDAYRTGTAIPNLDTNALMAELPVVLPSAAVADAFARMFFSSRHVRFIEETQRLLALRDTLLPVLVSGRLQVVE